MKKENRRSFLKQTAWVTAGVTLAACSPGNNQKSEKEISNQSTDPLFLSMTSDQIMTLLDMTVEKYMALSGNCAQSGFLALKDVFELPGEEIVKALTPMPGIAEKGLTCGALTGPLMALGLVYGREDLSDWEAYRSSLEPTGRFVDQFKEEQGTTTCGEIHEHEFGERFNLVDEEELKKYRKAGGPSVCSGIVKKSVRLAAAIILEKYQDS